MSHVNSVWPRLLFQALRSKPQPGGQGELRQISGCHVVLDGSYEQFLTDKRRKLSPIYASAELLWYLKRTHSIEMISAYAPSYEKYAENGQAYGAYGGRIGENDGSDLLYSVIAALRERPFTKKAVVGLWRPSDLLLGNYYKDIPCTISWQFLQNHGMLDMVVSMRSNDLWRGFLYDVYVNTCIHKYVASRVGMLPGQYIHNAGSMHLYERDVKKAEEVLEQNLEIASYTRYCPLPKDWDLTERSVAKALQLEEDLRLKNKPIDEEYQFSEIPIGLLDALACCQLHFLGGRPEVSAAGLQYAIDSWVV